MSKPEPIEYNLDYWNITYSRTYYESSQATGTQHFQANIYWKAVVGDKKTTERQTENFVTFDKSKKWVEEQVGAKYV